MKRIQLGLASAIFAVLSLSGCSDGRGGAIPYDVSLAAPDRPKVAALGEGYRIAPLDTVSVKIFRVPDLSGDYEVDLTGGISLPLIGSVPAADLTLAELDQRLTERFGQKYLENPDVSVGLKSSSRQSVTVDGAVKQGGAFAIAGQTSLMQAVAMSGGASEDANLHRVAIFRTIGGKRQAAAFDLAAIRRGQAEDPPVYAGDIIVVDGSKIKALQKQIMQNVPLLAFLPL